MQKYLNVIVGVLLLGIGWTGLASAAEPKAKAKAEPATTQTILFLGDSITQGGGYVRQIDAELAKQKPAKTWRVINHGRSSETVSNLSEAYHPGRRPCLLTRIDDELKQVKPDWVVACYGINDGIYHPYNEKRFEAYQAGIETLIKKVHASGARMILLTAPPYARAGSFPADADAAAKETIFTKANTEAEAEAAKDPNKFGYRTPFAYYDEVMARYATWLLTLQGRPNVWVVDVRGAMLPKVKEAHGRDPIHPNGLGHSIMAEAFLKQWPAIQTQVAAKPGAVKAGDVKAGDVKPDDVKPDAAKPDPGKPAAAKPEAAKSDAPKKPGWNGYDLLNFKVDGRNALLVVPKTPAVWKPWIWRTEFFGVDPQADVALLGKGFHVAYIDIGGLFGAPVALDAMDKYYAYVRKTYDLSPKPVLEGFSRGGLYAFNWAARHPDQVSCLYVDAPVCDFKSWPGGKGRSRFAGREWRDVLKAYGMTDPEARAYKLNPVDNLAPLVKAKIPILSVIGDVNDWIVPIEENTLLVEKRYKELGGEIQVIKKPKAGHRPHSLPDPTPIVEFVL
ncbi:MAG: hypothetical protein K8T25_18520, partial [Planctomycetia bacterium]|nr:hypothetical protein [Planctomycetia bacterium]